MYEGFNNSIKNNFKNIQDENFNSSSFDHFNIKRVSSLFIIYLQIAALIKDNGIIYSLKEIWRKNFIGISNDNKILTYINSNGEQALISNINLEDLKQCNIIKHYYNDKSKVVLLQSLELELIYKSPVNKNLTIPFFNIDDDLIEDFELQRIEKWHNLILKAIPLQSVLKLAS